MLPTELKTIAERAAATYDGPVSLDRYGRRVPKSAAGSIALSGPTSATSRICDAVDELFCSIVDRRLLVRRLNVVAADLLTADQFAQRRQSDMSEYMQPDLFDALNSSSDSSIADAAGDEGLYDNAFPGCSQNNSSERPSSGASCDDAELHMQQTLLNIKRKFGKIPSSKPWICSMMPPAGSVTSRLEAMRHEPTQTHRYDDIIGLPHHQSRFHSRMSQSGRAAQFMPFAALTGYEAVIEHAALANEGGRGWSQCPGRRGGRLYACLIRPSNVVVGL